MKSTIESNIIALLTRADESPIIKFETDKSLVGGIIIQLGDRTLDLSTKKKLTELEKDLCNNSQSNI